MYTHLDEGPQYLLLVGIHDVEVIVYIPIA